MTTSSLDRLRRVPIFEGLDDDALRQVAEIGTESTVPAGHVLVEKGHGGAGLFVIESGTAVVELPDGEIERGPGDFVGELSLLTDAHRTARVQAKTEVTFLAIPRAGFERLLEDQPRIAVAMLRSLAARMVPS